MEVVFGYVFICKPQWNYLSWRLAFVVPGNKSGIVLLVLGGKGTPGMFNPVL
jgi:hypothetical protein